MTSHQKIISLIDQNNWVSLETLLSNQKGCISKNGCLNRIRSFHSSNNANTRSTVDIDRICNKIWSHVDFYHKVPGNMPDREYSAILNTYKILTRLYDEAEAALKRDTRFSKVSIGIQNAIRAATGDGFTPIQRLEKTIIRDGIADLKKNTPEKQKKGSQREKENENAARVCKNTTYLMISIIVFIISTNMFLKIFHRPSQ